MSMLLQGSQMRIKDRNSGAELMVV